MEYRFLTLLYILGLATAVSMQSDESHSTPDRAKRLCGGTGLGMVVGCHRPWYWREIYPDYGASRQGKTLE